MSSYLSPTETADAVRLRQIDPERYTWERLGLIYGMKPEKVRKAVESVAVVTPKASPEWPIERVQELQKLWREGKSALEAGMVLGVSRNSIISKLHRLGLTGGGRVRIKPRSVPMAVIIAEGRARAPGLKPDAERPTISAPPSKNLCIYDLTAKTCRWPSGDKVPYTFCGHDVVEGGSYCPEHNKAAYVQRGEDDEPSDA